MAMIEKMDVTLDELKHLVSNQALTGDTLLLNMGPQHPSTHGVLRLLRITSYNVCYTKLLRGAGAARRARQSRFRAPPRPPPSADVRALRRSVQRSAGPPLLGCDRRSRRPRAPGGVITSYSIHYTKLYEFLSFLYQNTVVVICKDKRV